MPKAKFEFDLPEENYEFECYVKALQLQSTLDEVDNYCRNKLKYEDLHDDTTRHLENIRELVLELTS